MSDGETNSEATGTRWVAVAVGVAVLAVVLAAVALVVGRGGDDDAGPASTAAPGTTSTTTGPSTSSSSDTSPGATGSTTPVVVDPESAGGRTPLPGFGQVLVTVEDPDGRVCELCLLLAETGPQRAQGLMEVTDPALGGYDGMWFDYAGSPGSGGFWMRNTRLPLHGVFLDPDLRYLASFPMVPCPDSTPDPDCPRYGPGAPFGAVIELPVLRPEEVGLVAGATVRVIWERCPEVLAGRA